MLVLQHLVCCNKLVKKLIANTEDLGKEKHVPVVESLDGGIVVKVGSIEHPMVSIILHLSRFLPRIT